MRRASRGCTLRRAIEGGTGISSPIEKRIQARFVLMADAAAAAGKKGLGCMETIRRRGFADPPAAPLQPRPARSGAAAVRSVTRDEIDRFWRRKRMEEEDHLLAALKAAARIRARNLKEEDYRQFEASLEGILKSGAGAGADAAGKNAAAGVAAGNEEELRAVMRDWWTKSKYAYLNQPALQSMEPEAATNRASSFTPNACFYPVVVSTKPCSALGVF